MCLVSLLRVRVRRSRTVHVAIASAAKLKMDAGTEWSNVGAMISDLKNKQGLMSEPDTIVRWGSLLPGDLLYVPPFHVVISKVVHSAAVFIRVQAGGAISHRVARVAQTQ